MEETLTLVDENDNEIGRETREKCHLGKGKMHRAIAVFLFNNKNLMLIQQRSQKKLLWPRYWDCTVATHVYPNETYEDAAKRGLKQELGISPSVERILAFTYFAPFGNYAENEYCALLIGRYDGVVTPNPSEVSSFDYVCLKELKKEMTRKSQVHTPWFKIALEKFLEHPISRKFW
jgi:isopentenyl-diphosphate delta-isomerase